MGGSGDGPDRFADLGSDELGPDHLFCKGSDDDCGAFVCTDCSISSFGHRCITKKCGCTTAADCDRGRACVNGTCHGSGCSNDVPCRGGCCDRGTCIAGSEAANCGSDGKSCAACAGDTPTCIGGACSGDCIAGKPGEEGVCSPGYCCGANNRCQKVADNACASEGGLCADCSAAGTGPKCVLPAGTCGCSSSADCPAGQACRASVCGAACDANTQCNGGCCAGGTCARGSAGAACATGNAQCEDCGKSVRGAACIAGGGGASSCGCNSQLDCPVGQACDPATHVCGLKCDPNALCNGGCCLAGQCAVGTSAMACGSDGSACVNCGGSPFGITCIAAAGGGHCGCTNNNQCVNPAATCDGNLSICSRACSANLKCLAGCCSNAQNGMCLLGNGARTCGAGGGVCTDCSMMAAGHACRGGQQCGCNSSLDCAVGQACDPVTHGCSTKCGPNQPCNGGCCGALGTCVAGSDAAACGSGGDTCVDCGKSALGHACVAGRCGCGAPADCAALASCDLNTKLCSNTCDLDKRCRTGCCLRGTCVPGSANSACGMTGGTCVVCSGEKPTCDGAACTASCGGPGNGQCSGGFCCRQGTCVAGNAQTACGSAGVCQDCSASPDGTRCVLPMMGSAHCGCTDRTDCPAANSAKNLPGRACDTNKGVEKCGSACGAAGISSCNGGCCTGANGQCSGGAQQEACGLSGGYCSDCLASCSPGPKCNPMTGACGCSSIRDCFYELQCQIVVQREACSIPRGTCCVPAWFNGHAYRDNGSPANCCTGMSNNGFCTCVATGQPSGGDASRCCSQHDTAGACSCLPNGAACLLESDANGECCSGQCKERGRFLYQCVESIKGQPCQTDAGCAQGLKCVNQKCA